jgi:hypothetical protein
LETHVNTDYHLRVRVRVRIRVRARVRVGVKARVRVRVRVRVPITTSIFSSPLTSFIIPPMSSTGRLLEPSGC